MKRILGVITPLLLFIVGCSKETPVSRESNWDYVDRPDPIESKKFPTFHLSQEEIRRFPKPSISFGGIEESRIKGFTDLEYFMPPLHRTGQGSIGSCTSWAVGYSAASYYLNKKQVAWSISNLVSPSYIYSLTRLPKGGSYISEAMQLVVNKGAIFLRDKPYSERECYIRPNSDQIIKASKHRLSGWEPIIHREMPDIQMIENDSRIIRSYLSENHPVVIATLLNNEYPRIKNDIYEASAHNSLWRNNPYIDTIGHAMTIIGHNDRTRTYKIMNSWGEPHFIKATYEAVHQGLVYAAVFTDEVPNNENIDSDPQPEPQPDIKSIININKRSIDFGRVETSSSSPKITIRISNMGNIPIKLNINISEYFEVLSNNIYIEGNSYKDIEVLFSKKEPGKYSSKLIISTPDEQFVQEIPIKGEYYTKMPLREQKLILNGNLNFGRVYIGNRQRRSFSIENPTSEPIEIYDISTPEGFNIIGNTQFSINPNGRKSVQVEFEPERSRRYSGTIEIGSSLNNVARIQVSGQGEEERTYDPEPQPHHEDFYTTPQIGTFTNPIFDDIRGSCGLYFHSKGNIVSSVIRAENDEITIRVKKTNGAFSKSGSVYIKKGSDPCSEDILARQSYYSGDSYVDLTFRIRNMRKGDSITVIPTLTANDVELERFYGQHIRISKR